MEMTSNPTVLPFEQNPSTFLDPLPLLTWMVDAQGKRVYTNAGWQMLTGHASPTDISYGDGNSSPDAWLQVIHPDDRLCYLQAYMSAFAHHQPFALEYRVCGQDGQYHRLVENGRPLRSDDGEFRGYIGAALEVSACQRATEPPDTSRQAELDLHAAFDATLEVWARALDARKKETDGHSQRVARLTVDIARLMGMRRDELVHVRRGALLHDIGDMKVPDAILLKPGALLPNERVLIRSHPTFAYQMLSHIDFLRPALDIPYCHHERWDGAGYPRGLKGEQIPLSARIFTVVDVWDALHSERPYRRAWPDNEVWEYLTQQAGTEFDPAVVRVFCH
jgi:putative nucleotidyltransferase with HDIG domain